MAIKLVSSIIVLLILIASFNSPVDVECVTDYADIHIIEYADKATLYESYKPISKNLLQTHIERAIAKCGKQE